MKKHLLILLHGITKNSRSMGGLKKFINQYGFDVLNIHYPSTKFPIEKLVDIIHSKIDPYVQGYEHISFVGFSMGGLLTRAYLNKYKLKNLNKVIFIGTPNKGSRVADFLVKFELFNKLYGPALKQLVTNRKGLEDIFGKVYYECGVISGNMPLDTCFIFTLGEAGDGKVSIESTKIEGMKDHIVLNLPHWYMTRSKKVWYNVLHFLQNSKFEH